MATSPPPDQAVRKALLEAARGLVHAGRALHELAKLDAAAAAGAAGLTAAGQDLAAVAERQRPAGHAHPRPGATLPRPAAIAPGGGEDVDGTLAATVTDDDIREVMRENAGTMLQSDVAAALGLTGDRVQIVPRRLERMPDARRTGRELRSTRAAALGRGRPSVEWTINPQETP